MRRTRPGIAIGILLLGVLVLLAVFGAPRDPLIASPGRPAVSPSGAYTLVVREIGAGNGCTFEIHAGGDASGPIVHYYDGAFSTNHQLWFLWDQMDRVWVYSGDVGTYFWERAEDGQWREFTYVESDVPAPAQLRKWRPK